MMVSSFFFPLALSILVIIASVYRRRYPRRLKNSPPSPPCLPLIGHLHLLKKPLHRSLAALSSRHGDVVSLRFGSRPTLLISSASAAVDCFSRNDIAFANRPRLLAGKHLGYNYSSLVWASYGPHWRNLRRISTVEIFSSSRIDSFAQVRKEEVSSMVKVLASDSTKGRMVKVLPRLLELTLNMMMLMVAGKRFCGEEGAEARQARLFLEIVKEIFEVVGVTNLADFFPALRWFDYKGFEKRIIKLHEKRDAFLQELLEERREKGDGDFNLGAAVREQGSGKRTRCLIDVLLSLQAEDNEVSDEIIKGLMVVILLAGTDTSALTVEWALAFLLSNPASLAKAMSDLNSRVGTSSMINESDLPNLPFLNSIIKETLRLRPVAPIIPHESAMKCKVGGSDIPKGTMLLVNAWEIHRDPELWEEPEAFRPERWEGVEEMGKRSGKMMAFGMGRRGCPGEGLAMLVVGSALGALLQCFEWELDSGKELDISEGDGLSIPMATPLTAICKLRPFVTDDWLA